MNITIRLQDTEGGLDLAATWERAEGESGEHSLAGIAFAEFLFHVHGIERVMPGTVTVRGEKGRINTLLDTVTRAMQ